MTERREKPRLLASTDAKLYAVAVIVVAYLIAWRLRWDRIELLALGRNGNIDGAPGFGA
jgi:hypothetical protein